MPRTPTYPEPFPGEPVDLPIEGGGRSWVANELGVDVYFDSSDGFFTAQISGVEGRGAASALRSSDFKALLDRIRERALVVPVEAYLLSVDEQAADDADLVRVVPCTVIEHHPRRSEPFVIRVIEHQPRLTAELRRRPPLPVKRIRTTACVYLPEPEQLAALRAATAALRDEHVRHRAEVDRLGRAQRDAEDRVSKLSPDDLKRVQDTRQQVAHAQGELVFELTPDPEPD